ncbi:MAG: TIGR03936 family radical SAM-associated protein [Chloroflexi bacterium]|nr:TIGR03936 family radical SAM-associated protein [Chloroflexota bacterium]
MHRLRLKFGRGEQLKFLSHLDLMRLWERSLRRAGIELSYSEGFSPHPRISLAAPLAVGVTSVAELMDIFLEGRITAGLFVEKVGAQLPGGLDIIEILPVGIDAPSLQSRLRFAEYAVAVKTTGSAGQAETEISALLAKETLPWHHARDTGERFYDLRPLIDGLWLEGKRDEGLGIGMRLRCDASGSGRPEQVARALGFSEMPQSIQRTRLVFA